MFCLDGKKHFIIQDDKKIIEKILFDIERMTSTGNKTALVNIRFNLNACKNLSEKELDALSGAATNFFHSIQVFGNKVILHEFVNIWMAEDRVQDLDSVTCSIFQIYFYENFFNPDESHIMQNKKRVNKRTIETLLNEPFVPDDQDKNKTTIKQ